MAAPARIELTRHYHELSATDTDAVIQTVADLIVSYLKGDSGLLQHASAETFTRALTPPAATDAQQKETRS